MSYSLPRMLQRPKVSTALKQAMCILSDYRCGSRFINMPPIEFAARLHIALALSQVAEVGDGAQILDEHPGHPRQRRCPRPCCPLSYVCSSPVALPIKVSIHPFQDGNGRTIVFFCLAAVLCRAGGRQTLLPILNKGDVAFGRFSGIKPVSDAPSFTWTGMHKSLVAQHLNSSADAIAMYVAAAARTTREIRESLAFQDSPRALSKPKMELVSFDMRDHWSWLVEAPLPTSPATGRKRARRESNDGGADGPSPSRVRVVQQTLCNA